MEELFYHVIAGIKIDVVLRDITRYYDFRHINSRYEAFHIFLLFLSEGFSHLFVYHFFNLILDTI